MKMLIILHVFCIFAFCNSFLHEQFSAKFLNAFVKKIDVKKVNFFINNPVGLNETSRRLLWKNVNALMAIKTFAELVEGKESELKGNLQVVPITSEKDMEFLVKAASLGYLRLYDWLILADPNDLQPSEKYPYLPLDNTVTFATLAASSSPRINILEAYQASSYLPYVVNKLGSWTESRGMILDQSEAAARRTNLTGLHLRCVTMAQAPFVYLSKGLGGDHAVIEKGYALDVWKSLQEKFGFTYSCRRPLDNQFGTITDGKWSGMVKTIQEREADVIVTALDFTSNRSQIVDYPTGLKTIGFRMVVRRPGLMESTWTSFTMEFVSDVWIVTLFSLILLIACMVLVSRFSPMEKQSIPLRDAVVLTLGALAYQGSWLNVTSTSSRTVFFTIFLGTLLLYFHYTSALVANLTVASESSVSFSTLQGLKDTSSFDLGFQKGISLEDFFRSSRSSPFEEIWTDIIEPKRDKLPKTAEEGLERVIKSSSYVHMMERNQFRFEFSDQCELKMLKQGYFSTSTGFAFAKGSPYIKAFNIHLNKLRSTGSMDRFWKRWQPPGSLCNETPLIALTIGQLFTAFLVLLTGMIVSIFICLPIERYSRSNCQDRVIDISHKDSGKGIVSGNKSKNPADKIRSDFKSTFMGDEEMYAALGPRGGF